MMPDNAGQALDREHELPITRQARLLDISRGTVYYQPKPISPRD